MREILKQLAEGKISVEEAERALKLDSIEKVSSIARLDMGRENRRGVPEIILAEGKTANDLLAICSRMIEGTGRAIVSRLNDQQISQLETTFGTTHDLRRFAHAKSLVIHTKNAPQPRTGGRVGILTAGTVDLPVAEEASMIAEQMGCITYLESDVGVAGIHRLIEPLTKMITDDVDALIVVAGREGALPTVVAGLVDLPLIAVPSSSGYGYGGHGQAALMAMLQACSLGLAVVNIDSGIAAGVVAAQIANRAAKARNS